jgi:hypothetical protein
LRRCPIGLIGLRRRGIAANGELFELVIVVRMSMVLQSAVVAHLVQAQIVMMVGFDCDVVAVILDLPGRVVGVGVVVEVSSLTKGGPVVGKELASMATNYH